MCADQGGRSQPVVGDGASLPSTVWGRLWLLLDKHFNSLWWGFVLMCLALGVNRVVDAVLAVFRAFGVVGAG